jgi:hypothetical protein
MPTAPVPGRIRRLAVSMRPLLLVRLENKVSVAVGARSATERLCGTRLLRVCRGGAMSEGRACTLPSGVSELVVVDVEKAPGDRVGRGFRCAQGCGEC